MLLRLGKVEAVLARFLPWKFVKHQVRPLLIWRKQSPYDPKSFFESYYGMVLDQEFSDGITTSMSYNPLFSRYHYNSVENSIIEYFASRQIPRESQVLDVGSGAGHWVDFYLDVFGAKSVIGIEISKRCVSELRLKYEGADNVRIVEADISSPNFNLGQKFDIISAIGIMFHIVDDELWRRALRNLANHLNDHGVAVVGGHFGWITRNVQFHTVDEFSTWEEAKTAESKVVLVNKRIRSLRYWKDCAQQVGLGIECLQRTRQRRGIRTPENNVLILSHR